MSTHIRINIRYPLRRLRRILHAIIERIDGNGHKLCRLRNVQSPCLRRYRDLPQAPFNVRVSKALPEQRRRAFNIFRARNTLFPRVFAILRTQSVCLFLRAHGHDAYLIQTVVICLCITDRLAPHRRKPAQDRLIRHLQQALPRLLQKAVHCRYLVVRILRRRREVVHSYTHIAEYLFRIGLILSRQATRRHDLFQLGILRNQIVDMALCISRACKVSVFHL